jgi:hypothetical protein
MVQTAGPYPRPLVLLIAAAVGWTVFTLVRFQMPAGNGLAARYYNNASLAGVPVETGYDPVPSAARMAGRWQGRPPLAFGVVWTGYLTVGSTDQYRFATTSDDGSKLFVDERLVVDNSGPHGSETKTGTIALSRGSHRVRLEYTQFGGASELIWSWGRGDAPLMPVPAWALSRRAVRNATLTVLRLVEIVRWLAAILGATAAAWYIAVSVQRVSPRQMAKQAADAYGGAASLAFAVCILVAFLLMPGRADMIRASTGRSNSRAAISGVRCAAWLATRGRFNRTSPLPLPARRAPDHQRCRRSACFALAAWIGTSSRRWSNATTGYPSRSSRRPGRASARRMRMST